MAILKSIARYLAPVLLAISSTWRIIGHASNLDFVLSANGDKHMVEIWQLLTSPTGNIVELAIGVVWIVAEVRGQRLAAVGSSVAASSGSDSNVTPLPVSSDDDSSSAEYNSLLRQSGAHEQSAGIYKSQMEEQKKEVLRLSGLLTDSQVQEGLRREEASRLKKRLELVLQQHTEEGKRQYAARLIANLKEVPREIKARWPGCDFVNRPAWQESWYPSKMAVDPPWLPFAVQWHKGLMSIPELRDHRALESFEFEELMEYLDNVSSIKAGVTVDRWSIEGMNVNAQILEWAQGEITAGVQSYGFVLKNHGDPVKNIEIGTFSVGRFRFEFSVLTKSMGTNERDVVAVPVITDTFSDPPIGVNPCASTLNEIVMQHAPKNNNGFRPGIPLRLYCQGVSGGRIVMKRHELRFRNGAVDIYCWSPEGLSQAVVRC